jgi:hypothetical protein
VYNGAAERGNCQVRLSLTICPCFSQRKKKEALCTIFPVFCRVFREATTGDLIQSGAIANCGRPERNDKMMAESRGSIPKKKKVKL